MATLLITISPKEGQKIGYVTFPFLNFKYHQAHVKLE